MIEAYGRVCPTLKNVTCFDRWAPMAQAKAHPTLLWSFGTQRTAGINYGVPGIPVSMSLKLRALILVPKYYEKYFFENFNKKNEPYT